MSKPNDNKSYKGHTYRVNRDTGYVEIDGQPVTLTNTDPHFWARQYIDKTEALMAAKAPQPQPPQGELGKWQDLADSAIADALDWKRKARALQAQRDELLDAATQGAIWLGNNANSDEGQELADFMRAAIARVTEGGTGQ